MGKISGKFQLEPDGFSIHTFEVTKKLSGKEYRKLVDETYCRCPPGQIYRDKTWQGAGERHRCKWFQREGLRISFEQDIHHQVVSCRLRIAVNPRKLIDPNSSYVGILPPTEESVGAVFKAFFMFRGTLKLNTLIATLQMVDHICDAAIFMSDDELHDLPWSSFVSAIKEPELVQYLKERNLYINEPVEVEGEV